MKEKVLILGGTEFVGRQLVEALIGDVTKDIYLFNRGKTNPDLFPEVKKIIGDRESDDIEKIRLEKWDYVIDFSSYYPRSLEKTLQQINKEVKKYIYISTISVYDFKSYDRTSEINEDYKKLTCSAEEAVDQTMRTYGQKKVACEEVLEKVTWLNTVVLRPSVIYGKHDPTDRLYYWLRKIKKSKALLIPGNGEALWSLTYAEDLVMIIERAMADQLPNGVYNCSTHPPISLRDILEIMKDLTGSTCEFYGMEANKLSAKKIRLPLTFLNNLWVGNAKIKAALGQDFIPFRNSIQSIINFYKGEAWRACAIGMDEEQEEAIIEQDRMTP